MVLEHTHTASSAQAAFNRWGAIFSASTLDAMKHMLIVGAMFITSLTPAQNWVPNPSFENYSSCPDNLAQIDRSIGWEMNAYTPDYYNACASLGDVGVPANLLGYQAAAEGSAYAGIIVFAEEGLVPEPELYREHLGRFLSAPLTPGLPVHVSFKTSPAAFGAGAAQVKWTCAGVGVRFTMGPLDPWNPLPPVNQAAVHLAAVLSDTSEWVIVSGTYVPDSAYEYILIGNFFSDSLSSPSLIDDNGNYGVAYVYIDDVCVSTNSEECEDGSSISEDVFRSLYPYPNPCLEVLSIALMHPLTSPLQLSLLDSFGRCVQQVELQKGETRGTMQMGGIASGTYTLIGHARGIVTKATQILHLAP